MESCRKPRVNVKTRSSRGFWGLAIGSDGIAAAICVRAACMSICDHAAATPIIVMSTIDQTERAQGLMTHSKETRLRFEMEL
jgi:hypothetical protein